ncbi:hypothetical protein SDC9_62855 [bioreactor metagenome]|uniref:KOW domain-containing protein n=1 Tax=bioreactor metagenome TaxID=1076179 RepID=A0A644XQR6_9ZZZZ
MEFERGQIVRSLAGHDKGRYFFVMDAEDGFLILADGKERKVDSPKRKRRKHTQSAGPWRHPVSQQLQSGALVPDSELRRALAAFREEHRGDKGGFTLGKKRHDRA